MRRLSMLSVVRFLRAGQLRSCVNLEQLRARGYRPAADTGAAPVLHEVAAGPAAPGAR